VSTVNGGYLYGLSSDKSAVSIWTATANNWTVIGGPAQAIASS
jgi:hypothetical protein